MAETAGFFCLRTSEQAPQTIAMHDQRCTRAKPARFVKEDRDTTERAMSSSRLEDATKPYSTSLGMGCAWLVTTVDTYVGTQAGGTRMAQVWNVGNRIVNTYVVRTDKRTILVDTGYPE